MPSSPSPFRGRGEGSESHARRLAVTLLAALPWPLVLSQFLLVLPRYDRLYRDLGLELDSLTQFLLDASAWARTYFLLAFLATFALMGASAGLAYAVQSPRVPRPQRLLLLFALFAVPCAVFVLSWVGVMDTHRRLVEGLRQ